MFKTRPHRFLQFEISGTFLIAVGGLVLGIIAVSYLFPLRHTVYNCNNDDTCVPVDKCTPQACINNVCTNLAAIPGCCPSEAACATVTPADYIFNIANVAGNEIIFGPVTGTTATYTQSTSFGNSFNISLPRAGSNVPSLYAHTTAVSAVYVTTNETDFLKTATCSPICTSAVGFDGFTIIGNTLVSGSAFRLGMYGSYSTSGATATVVQAIRATQVNGSISVIPGVGTASGTFQSAAGPLAWQTNAVCRMVDATHMSCTASVVLTGMNVAATTAALPGILGTAAGVVVDPTNTMVIAPTMTMSSNTAGNSFQLLYATLELLN